MLSLVDLAAVIALAAAADRTHDLDFAAADQALGSDSAAAAFS
jgi:hypothetical protein